MRYILPGLIICGVLGLWVLVQHWARKSDPNLPPDCDVLGDTGRGCRHCNQRQHCANRRDEDK